MSLCQYVTILKKGGVTEYTSVNRKYDVQQLGLVVCTQISEPLEKLSVSKQRESKGDARGETQTGAGWVPGQLSWKSEHAAICLAHQFR